MRVATYTRISTDEENQPYSLGAQEDRLAAFIRSQEGWDLSRKYTDQMTGSVLERPGLQQALRDARAGKYDLLLVYRVDRLARSVRGLAQILDELDHAKVQFRSATEPFENGTAPGRMMLQVLGAFAEFERATLIDRVVAGMERKAKRGEWHGGQLPYGYSGKTNDLQVVEEEAKVVRRIFSMCGEKTWGAKAIANALNAEGCRTRTGRPWGPRTVLDLLRNPVYVGDVWFRGVTYPGLHPAIVDRPTFATCAALLEERGESQRLKATHSSGYDLAGVSRCQGCRKRMLGTGAHGRSARYRYYVCYSRHNYGKHTCSARPLSADHVERAAWDDVERTFANTELMNRVLAKLQEDRTDQRPEMEEQLATVRAEIERVDKAVRRYEVAFENGDLAAADLGRRLRELGDQLRDLQARGAELEDQLANASTTTLTDEDLAGLGRRIREVRHQGTAEERKSLLNELIVELWVDGNVIRPIYRVPRSPVLMPRTLVDPRGFEPLTF